MHHFENGVWMDRCDCIRAIRGDIEDALSRNIRITEENWDASLIVRIFAPLL